MKQIIFSVVLTFIFCLNAQSQIQRTFFGCTLYTSTKSEVTTTLKNKGYKVEEISNDQIMIDNIQFAGIVWESVIFSFEGNRLLSVGFMNSLIIAKSKSLLQMQYRQLVETLNSKYSQYHVKDNGHNDSNTLIPQHFDLTLFISS